MLKFVEVSITKNKEKVVKQKPELGPGWIENTVEISAPKEELDAIHTIVSGPVHRFYNSYILEKDQPKIYLNQTRKNALFSFHRIKPMPYEIQLTRDIFTFDGKNDIEQAWMEHRYGANHWYEWALANWGCKWEARDVQVDMYDDCIEYVFYTYDTPPYHIADELDNISHIFGGLLSWSFNAVGDEGNLEFLV